MDPVTAFTIACGTIQFVGFSIKIVQTVRKMVQSSSGTSREYEELEAATLTLRDLMLDLKAPNQPTTLRHPSRGPQNPADVEISSATSDAIRAIASQCEDTAGTLIDLLGKIKVDRTTYKSALSRTFKAIKSITKTNKISKLESQLEGYRERVEKHIILDLRQSARALLDGTIQGFQDLQAEHKAIITAIGNNESSIGKLTKLIMVEGGKTRAKISAMGKKLADSESTQKFQIFLESLAFEHMFDREGRLGSQPAAPKTFRWLFDRDHRVTRPYDSFMDWLEGEQSIYWICGRAGSGKSTLMSFIWDNHDSKATDYLQKWSANNELITAAVFFWHQGSELQKSSAGLLRSLLYQIFQKHECRARKVMDLPNISQGIYQSWSEERLKSLLFSILDEPDVRVCLFIDGLDEYGSGDVVANDGILEIISELTAHANGRLKCCLSSRPLCSFEVALKTYPKLMLHKLTRPDMTRYVTGSLRDVSDTSLFLIEDVVDRANGVFLWAVFAVRSLKTAHINGDTEAQVQQRLNELPSELDDLYSHMLLKIDPVYWREAALYFALDNVLFLDCNSVVHYVLASEDTSNYLGELTLPWTPERVHTLREDCAKMEKWVKVRTGGLLEVVVHNFPRYSRHSRFGKQEDDLSKDGSSSDCTSESPIIPSEELDLPGTHESAMDLATFNGLLELRDTKRISESEAIVEGPSDEKAIEHYLCHREVVAIHRSVTEFFESQKQNKIFLLCPIGTAYLKSIRAHTILSTIRNDLGFQMDKYIIDERDRLGLLMSIAAQAEELTEQPSRLDIDRLGSILATVKGPEWPANVPTNFASTFLSFTALYGLNLYVQDSMKNDPPTVLANRPSALNEALLCATSHSWDQGSYEQENWARLELIAFLLNAGADPHDVAPPSLLLGNMTAWKAFLVIAIWPHVKLHASHGSLIAISKYRDTLKRFVDCDADPHQEFVYTLDQESPPIWMRQESSEDSHYCFRYILRANAAFVLAQYGLPCDFAQSYAAMDVVWLQYRDRQEHDTDKSMILTRCT
ncbi:hypothetical protein MMC30_004281 [Trapelia coarctata]|nr:hypothetical protein [Trapelia coarctata]